MRFKTRKARVPFDRTQWHPWFAWYPVVTKNGNRIWLEIVWRKIEWQYYFIGSYSETTYKEYDQTCL